MEPAERKVFAMPLVSKALTTDGTFEGYLTLWDEPDFYGDIVKRGAFTKTLQEKGNTRPLLWQHDYREPVGILTAREDDKGLFIKGELNLEVQRAKEAYALLKQGSVNGLSQGFDPVKWEPRPEPGQLGRIFIEIDLWEGSLATFPALPKARVLNVRAAPRWLDEPAKAPAVDERASEWDAAVQRMLTVAGETLKRVT